MNVWLMTISRIQFLEILRKNYCSWPTMSPIAIIWTFPAASFKHAGVFPGIFNGTVLTMYMYTALLFDEACVYVSPVSILDALVAMEKAMKRDNIVVNDRQLACARINSQEGQDYLKGMAGAANYAWVNRSSMTFLCRQVCLFSQINNYEQKREYNPFNFYPGT